MAGCGCSVQAIGCEVGQQLAIDVWCGYEVIESPHFPSLPLAQREAIWQQYQQAVAAYLWHCAYGDEGEECKRGEGHADNDG